MRFVHLCLRSVPSDPLTLRSLCCKSAGYCSRATGWIHQRFRCIPSYPYNPRDRCQRSYWCTSRCRRRTCRRYPGWPDRRRRRRPSRYCATRSRHQWPPTSAWRGPVCPGGQSWWRSGRECSGGRHPSRGRHRHQATSRPRRVGGWLRPHPESGRNHLQLMRKWSGRTIHYKLLYQKNRNPPGQGCCGLSPVKGLQQRWDLSGRGGGYFHPNRRNDHRLIQDLGWWGWS